MQSCMERLHVLDVETRFVEFGQGLDHRCVRNPGPNRTELVIRDEISYRLVSRVDVTVRPLECPFNALAK